MTTVEKHKSQRSETKLVGEARIAFPFFHVKRTKSAGGKALDQPRHDGVILVPKLAADPMQCANYNLLASLCMEAATKAWGSFPQGGKWPIQDGDVPHASKPKPGVVPMTPEQQAAKNVWRKGSWIIEVSTKLEPGPRVCVMQNGVAVEIPAQNVAGVQLYKSGDYGYVSLSAYTFHNETFGVNFGFEGVLFTRPGEAIGSSGPRSAAAMFGSVAGTATPPAPMPGAGHPYAPGGIGIPPQPPAAAGQPPAMPSPPVAPIAPQYVAPPAPPPAPGAPPMPPAAPGMPMPAFPQPGR